MKSLSLFIWLTFFSAFFGRGRERGMRSTVHPRLMKMVLSATITRDPSKIAQLALHCPMYIAQSAADNRYQLPEQLQAFKLVRLPAFLFGDLVVSRQFYCN